MRYIRQGLHQNPQRDDVPYPHPGASAKRTIFCTLLEDMPSGHESTAKALVHDWDGTIKQVIDLHNWGDPTVPAVGIIDGAQAGYWMTAEHMDGRWRYEQGPCVEACASAGSIDMSSVTGATEETPYSFTPASTNIDADTFALGYGPPWVTVAASNGEISGTPPAGSAGDVVVVVSGLSPKTGSLTGEYCTVSKAVTITISE